MCVCWQLDMNMLYAGRIVAGVGMGGLSMVAPLYQSETAPAQVRQAPLKAPYDFQVVGQS